MRNHSRDFPSLCPYSIIGSSAPPPDTAMVVALYTQANQSLPAEVKQEFLTCRLLTVYNEGLVVNMVPIVKPSLLELQQPP